MEAVQLYRTSRESKLLSRVFERNDILKKYLLNEIQLAGGRPLQVLEIGCGRCRTILTLSRWAKSQGLDIRFTCIDTDRRTIASSNDLIRRSRDSAILILDKDIFQYQPQQMFDCATSSAFFRSLSGQSILSLIERLRSFTRSSILINDRRHHLRQLNLAQLLSHVENSMVTASNWPWSAHAMLRFTETRKSPQHKAA